MKKIIVLITISFFAMVSMAQETILRGKVSDKETGETLPFVNVYWVDKSGGTTTDIDGLFKLASSDKLDSLIIEYIGYKKVTMVIPHGTDYIDIVMESDVLLLEGVVIEHDSPRYTLDCATTMSRCESKRASGEGYYGGAPASYGDMPSNEIASGQLTAGEVNDFSKWELWTDIASGELSGYQKQWGMAPEHRFSVQVTNKNDYPIQDASVALIDETGNTIWAGRTDNTGKVELWSGMFSDQKSKSLKIVVNYMGGTYNLKKVNEFSNGINFIEIPVECSAEKVIDIAFMIDATGSMGDEIRYLQSEITNVIQRVKDSLPDHKIRLASVFYRDLGDSYVVIKKDFTEDIVEAVKYLQSQSAGGGGDYPEGVDTALAVSVNELSWSAEASSRLLFMVLDAPPHEGKENLELIEKTIPVASEKGIRIVPLACSGVNKSTEYLLRSMALATNGTYVFLTDHSGIGNPHIEPTTDEYEVELLNDALVRIITTFSRSMSCTDPLVLPQDSVNNDTSFVMMNPPKDSIPQDSLVTDSMRSDTLLADTLSPIKPEISWKYYPNPTVGQLTVEIMNLPLGEKKGQLFLTDITGKLLRRFEVKDDEKILMDISEFPTGTYYLTFFYGEESKLSAPVILVH
ncbi:MAG: carboxypeptidase-like regulatory domain-containing protein [Bacteroidales bacterium]|nr:carboxypeptidase-like regulatory domain-containing protein [Bacteroidales bacterium]